jgi:hypothetical protein
LGGSADFRCLDFHSFRRAFNTALGAVGVNVQQAMALAGHRTASTHLVYVKLSQRGALKTPAAALPALQEAAPVPLALPPANDSRARQAGRISNLPRRRVATEPAGLRSARDGLRPTSPMRMRT